MTTPTTSTNNFTGTITETIDQHLAGYCEPDAGRRAALLTAVWSADGTLVDPPMDGTGHDAICSLVDVVLAMVPPNHDLRQRQGATQENVSIGITSSPAIVVDRWSGADWC